MSLTDRMAAALRDELARHEAFIRSEYEGTSLLAEKLAESDASRVALAEYEAERNQPPVKRIPQVGQHVRCVSEPHWHGTVLYSKGSTTTVQMDNGEDFLAMTYDLEIIPNLPATNTGD